MADVAEIPAVAPAATTAETSTDTYVPVFKKESKKKEVDQEDPEFIKAKAFLSTKSKKDKSSVYGHLTKLVSKILKTKPTNAFDSFEEISAQLKKSQFNAESPLGLKHKKSDDSADAGEIPDIMDLANLWDWAGVSFGKDETFVLLVALKKLVDEKPLKSVRLWGKIFGTQKNYIIVEGELKEGATDEDDALANPKAEEPKQEAPPAEPVEGQNPEEDERDAPKPKQKPSPYLPVEQRAGANKYVYYVCNYAGGPWTRLPDVIPEKLQISRQIRKLFTGDLSRKINSYPVFGATEAQYLRCQIARISAATVVSPAGYYIPDPEEAENEGNSATIIINTEFEGLPNDQLLSPANWVHHVPYILPQGRMTWENPFAKRGGEDGEEQGDDEEEKTDEEANEPEPEPESGPVILGPLNNDEENGDSPAWTSRFCSSISPQKFSPVVLRSTRWPGAVVVSYNDKFANIYIGDGLKDLGSPIPKFAPPALPAVQTEYVVPEATPELLAEQVDPTVEAEAAYEAEQKAKEDAAKAEDEPEGEEPEEDE